MHITNTAGVFMKRLSNVVEEEFVMFSNAT